MAGLFDKQAATYVDARPRYPSEWFSMLAALTPHHSLAWDVGSGNGQAALGSYTHKDKGKGPPPSRVLFPSFQGRVLYSQGQEQPSA
ncbi:unnamed protein product [Dovyalis caffra]|uniref:Uncharacterized protein n=1 Tax=Dovyalis caffra TaxID=77055 RepID=A0AAV1SPT3_9ROSI|nr:unnamed protein product [Dovyalis caffra]